MPRRSLARLYKDEFLGYSLAKYQQDLLAGLTIAGVYENAYNIDEAWRAHRYDRGKEFLLVERPGGRRSGEAGL